MLLSACVSSPAVVADTADFTTHFHAQFSESKNTVLARIEITQADGALRRLSLRAPSDRYTLLSSDGESQHKSDRFEWNVPKQGGKLTYRLRIDRKRSNGEFDAKHDKDWAILSPGTRFSERYSPNCSW